MVRLRKTYGRDWEIEVDTTWADGSKSSWYAEGPLSFVLKVYLETTVQRMLCHLGLHNFGPRNLDSFCWRCHQERDPINK